MLAWKQSCNSETYRNSNLRKPDETVSSKNQTCRKITVIHTLLYELYRI